jgi:maleylacetoacetate isomerase
MALKLYSFWRSIATFRVRAAFNLKGVVPDELVFVDLLKGQQREDAFREVNPQMLLPALIDGDGPAMFQSMAIMEYLEETHPNPPLLPRDPKGRARVRGLCQIAVSDSHPMSVPRVRNYITNVLKLDQPTMLAWVRHWQTEAMKAYETHLTNNTGTGRYCHGDAITLADICLVGQAVGGSFFDLDLKPYPAVARIVDDCLQQEAFSRAHPLKQPGAPASLSH